MKQIFLMLAFLFSVAGCNRQVVTMKTGGQASATPTAVVENVATRDELAAVDRDLFALERVVAAQDDKIRQLESDLQRAVSHLHWALIICGVAFLTAVAAFVAYAVEQRRNAEF